MDFLSYFYLRVDWSPHVPGYRVIHLCTFPYIDFSCISSPTTFYFIIPQLSLFSSSFIPSLLPPSSNRRSELIKQHLCNQIRGGGSDGSGEVRSDEGSVVDVVMVIVVVIVMTVAVMVARVMVVIVMMASGFPLRLTPYLTAVSASHLARFQDEPQHWKKVRTHATNTILLLATRRGVERG